MDFPINVVISILNIFPVLPNYGLSYEMYNPLKIKIK